MYSTQAQYYRQVLSTPMFVQILNSSIYIVYYDRILVMDDGHVAEFDTVLNLFDKEDSIFRSLCDEAGLSRQDILRIRQESGNDLPASAST